MTRQKYIVTAVYVTLQGKGGTPYTLPRGTIFYGDQYASHTGVATYSSGDAATIDLEQPDNLLVGTLITTSGTGDVAGTGNTAIEYASGVHQTVVTLTDTAIVMADEAGVVGWGRMKIYEFPEGAVMVLSAVADIVLTKSSAGINDDWDGDFAVGTATVANDATLSSTEANIIPSTATAQAVAGVTAADGQSTVTEVPLIIDGTTTAGDVWLNFVVDDADHDITGTACNIICNGTMTLTWINLGDY